jgi:AraC-like DNA-binding protein
MPQTIPPIASPRYQGRFAVTAPELGIPYLAEAELTIAAPHDRHAHAEIQVLWVADGEMGMEVGREPLHVGPGSGLILMPWKRHRVTIPAGSTQARARIVDLRLTDGPTDPMAAFVRRLPAHQVIAGDPPAITAAADRVRSSQRATGPARTARMLSAVWDLLAELSAAPGDADASAATTDGGDAPADARLAKAERFLADHLADPIGVDAIADAVGLSRSQLTRLTVRHRGVGPAELLRRARVDRARQLLRTSSLAIKEVARVCGFVSQNHFSRVYFEATRVRPSAERRA